MLQVGPKVLPDQVSLSSTVPLPTVPLSLGNLQTLTEESKMDNKERERERERELNSRQEQQNFMTEREYCTAGNFKGGAGKIFMDLKK